MAVDEDIRHDNPEAPTPTTCVVIGGRSFIGRSLVSMLSKSEKWIVRIADSESSPKEKKLLHSGAIPSGKPSYFQVDLREKSQIIRAIEGSSVVFYMGAPGSSSSGFYDQYMSIVQGTKNVIHACKECNVKRLIYNSSADVVLDGKHDILNGDDSMPYPLKFKDMLSDLKAQAEELVLFANGRDGLATCVLRPSNAFGPGNMELVPVLLSAARSGLTKFIVGNGENMCDFTYVDNVAHAHICTEEALCSRTAFVAGKAFFITNLDPMKFWDFASLILESLGCSRPRFKVPAKIVWALALFSNWVHEKLDPNSCFTFTPFLHQASCTTTFNCSGGQSQIGYSPIVSLEDGVALTIESFSDLAEEQLGLRCRDCSNEPSKVDKLLGTGGVAEILLWRDEKKTFTYFLVMVVLYYWFFLCGRTFISSSAKLLLMLSVVLFSHGVLPCSLFGFNIKKLSPFHSQQVSETVKSTIISIAYSWNHCVQILRLLAQGCDWSIFFKVVACVYVLKMLCSLSLSAIAGIALVFAFTAFFVYMQYEYEIDRLVELGFNGVMSLKGLMMRNLPPSIAPFFQNDQTP